MPMQGWACGGVTKSQQLPVDVSPWLQSISRYPAGLSLGGEGDAERRGRSWGPTWVPVAGDAVVQLRTGVCILLVWGFFPPGATGNFIAALS